MWWIGAIAGGLIAFGLFLRESVAMQGRQTISRVVGLDIPGNARRVPEGYIVSGMLAPSSVPVLRREGIRLVLSAVELPASLVAQIRAAGIEWIPVPLGATFRHAETIDRETIRQRPERTLIHCTHGADRSGAILAYLLATQHGWTPSAALWAVLAPTAIDVHGLNVVLSQEDNADRRSLGDPGVGIYSPAAIGKSGGMKTRSADYRELARTTYQAILRTGARV